MKLSEFKNVWLHAHDSPFEGKMKGATFVISGFNESCGDEITLYLKLDSKKRITNVSFIHSGCTLSYVGSSVFSEKVIGKKLEEIKIWKEKDFLRWFDINISPARLKCVLLALETVENYAF